MTQLLIVSFDILREHDPTPAFSIASLLAYAGNHELCRSGRLSIRHHSFNLYTHPNLTAEQALEEIRRKYPLAGIDFIAFSVYVWAERLIESLMPALRTSGFAGRYILGGYQITATASNDLQRYYPAADYFLKGYAERSLMRAVGESAPRGQVFEDRPDFNNFPSLYRDGTIHLEPGKPIDMLRWETKRGCPYRCGFCEWRNAANKKIFEFPMARIEAELNLFKQYDIRKINVLDATFNAGRTYLDVARRMSEMNCTFSVQARFENLRSKKGREFVEICKSGNIHLEFGLQTVVPEEMKTIGRFNDLESVRQGMKILNQEKIPYEISLIFGIPGQSLASFLKSVNFVIRNGCTRIQCFPLRIPRSSRLEAEAAANCVAEREVPGNYAISQVVGSFSFDRNQWQRMGSIADMLRDKQDGCFLVQVKQGLSWGLDRISRRLEVGTRSDGSDSAPLSPPEFHRLAESAGDDRTLYCRLDHKVFPITHRNVNNDCIIWRL